MSAAAHSPTAAERSPADPHHPVVDLPARPPGPGSVTWYVAGDLRVFLVAVRALVLQVAYPDVGAGVGEHSVYKTDPYGRLWRTALSATRQMYGGIDSALEGQKLIRMHTDIKGVDAQGRRYHALRPEAYMWVHATMFDTFRLVLRELGPGLTPEQERRLFDEWRRVGLLIGVRPRVLPDTLDEFEQMWERVTTTVLENNPVVQDLLYSPPRKPPYVPLPQALLDAAARPLLKVERLLIADSLPADLRGRFGLPEPTRRDRRRLRRIKRIARWANHLPGVLRLGLLAVLQRRRSSRDPRLDPEPVPYP